MIYDKNFFTGLALVVSGLVLGGVALSFSLGGVSNIALDTGFYESSAAGGDTVPCVEMTCKPGAKAKDCGYDIGVKMFKKHSTIANKGKSIFFIGDLGKGAGSPGRDFEDAGFDFRVTTCDKDAVDVCKGYQLPLLFDKYENDVCTPNDKLEAKKSTPTPTPGAKLPEKELKKLFACTGYKCWYKAWNDPRLPLGTPDDPFFVDDTALWNMMLNYTEGTAFEHFLEKRGGIGHGTEICRSVCTGTGGSYHCDVHCQQL